MEVVAGRKTCLLKDLSSMIKNVEKKSATEISPKDKVYGVRLEDSKIYFDHKKDLKKYVNEHDLSLDDTFKVEYMGHCADNDNVIRIVKKDNITLYKIVDEYTCLKFDKDRSLKQGEPIWEFSYGNITSYYKALGRKLG